MEDAAPLSVRNHPVLSDPLRTDHPVLLLLKYPAMTPVIGSKG
jgi:hypothetical protein